jgi:hypothetical protein
MKKRMMSGILLAFACTALVHADLINQLSVAPSFSGGGGPCGTTINAAVGPSDQSCSTTGGFNSTGSGETLVDYGLIQVTGSAFGASDTVAKGVIQDSLIFHIPGVPDGTAGSFTYELMVSGNLAATSDLGEADWSLETNVGGGAFDLGASGRLATASASNPGFTGNPYGVFFATGHFQSGLPASLDIEFTGHAQARFITPGVPGSASDDSNLFWGGISGVTVGGAPVASSTVDSTSGTNWSQSFVPAVPEPAVSVTIGAGLILIGLLRRRKTKGRRGPTLRFARL